MIAVVSAPISEEPNGKLRWRRERGGVRDTLVSWPPGRVAPLSSRRTAATLMPDRPREFDRKRLLRMARPRWKRSAKLAVKTVVAVVVLWAVGRHVAKTWRDLQSHGETLHVEPAWVVAAAVLYLAGLSRLRGVLLADHGGEPDADRDAAAAIRAYLISHLGKYVPGKAMVVVMRVGLVAPYGARPATAAFATFYETLVMMAAGGLVAARRVRRSGPGRVARAGRAARAWRLGLAVGVPGRGLTRGLPQDLAAGRRCRFPNVGAGRAAADSRAGCWPRGCSGRWSGWVLLGLSQVAVVRAVVPGGIAPGLWPLVIGERGAGDGRRVRGRRLAGRAWASARGCLMTTLAPALGADTAVVAALALAAGLGGRRGWSPRLVLSAGRRRRRRTPDLRPRAGSTRHDQRRRPALQRGREPGHAPRRARPRSFEPTALGPVEFIFVDDGSRDGSWAVVRALAERDPRVRAHPVPPQLRQGRRADGRLPGRRAARSSSRSTATSRTTRPRSPGSSPSSTRGSTSSAAGSGRGTTPGTRSTPAGSSTGWSAA